MRRIVTCLALAFIAASVSGAGAAGDERLHVEFTDGMPAFVQTGARRDGGGEIPVHTYAESLARGGILDTVAGYVVKPASAGCDKPGQPCPDRRAALPDDRADDLPSVFSIEISDEPEAGKLRQSLRGLVVYPDGSGPWVLAEAGRSPYPSYETGSTLVWVTSAGKLRPGALAQADCFAGMVLCTVRISYSSDLRVNFLTQAEGEALAREVRAVDAFMQSVIRTGPAPRSPMRSTPTRGSGPDSEQSFIRGLPRDRVMALTAQPR